MKKIIFISSFLLIVLLLAVISYNKNFFNSNKAPMMDELSSQGVYEYVNRDLGFSLSLPAEFKYYQTQRKAAEKFMDLEVFVPTADTAIPKEVPGYAKPIVIRIFDKKYWNESMNDDERADYAKIFEKKEKIYALLFWNKLPSDWTAKWSDEMKKAILDGFKVK